MSDSSTDSVPVRVLRPGRFTRAVVHSPAGELEARLSEGGNWELRIKADAEHEWRVVCRGDMASGKPIDDPVSVAEEPIRLGRVTIDKASRSASVNGSPVQLARKEFTLLATLASQPNRVFTKAELLQLIWGYPDASRTRTLDCHAGRLRRKLKVAGAEDLVVNSWGVGYRFWDATELLAVPAPASAA